MTTRAVDPDLRPADTPSPKASLVNDLVVEAIGTFALIFMGAGAIIMTTDPKTGQGNLVAIALAHGLAIGLMVAATGHISGGAFNPAVVLALFLARKLDAVRAVGYVIAQLVGATVGAFLLTLIYPADMVNKVKLGTPVVGADFSAGNAVIAEFIATFFLAYVIFGVAIDKRGATTIASLAIGLTISMDIFATGAVSGAAMNPARWFGPAIVSGTFSDAWVWWVGPLIGASLAAVVYYYGYLRGRDAVIPER